MDESKIVKSPLGKVSIIFNHEIDEITLTEDNFCVFWGIEDKVPGRIEYNGSTKTASYIFDQKIKSNLRLTVIVKGIKDTKGNQIEELLYNIDVE